MFIIRANENQCIYPIVGDTLSLTAEKNPELTALVYPRKDQIWTYREFDERVNQLVNALSERGIKEGDRVSTLLFNTSELVLTMYATSKLGAVFNPPQLSLARR
jgi:long-chain acyl-CoA synthetase